MVLQGETGSEWVSNGGGRLGGARQGGGCDGRKWVDGGRGGEDGSAIVIT